MKILITGATGKLGEEFLKVYPDALTPDKQEMDITKSESIRAYFQGRRPDTVIHLAALTDIRKCEEDKELAWSINVEGTANLAKEYFRNNEKGYFVYISTACVFHGDRGNYSEEDTPYPKNFYSLTKLLGEFEVKCCNQDNWLIIRTNFVARKPWPFPKAFTDRWGTYLFADDLAQAIKQVVDKRLTGTVHVCGEEKMSMYELAKITTPDIQPMTINDYSGPALTQNMTLISKRIPAFKLKRKI